MGKKKLACHFGIFCMLLVLYALPFTTGTTIGFAALQQERQPEIEQYSQQAERAMAGKNWPEATKALEKLAQLAPDVPEVQGNLGLAYYSQNRLLEAAAAFERALKLDPKMAQARMMLGICFAETGRDPEAVSILAPIFAHPPDSDTGRLVGLDLEKAYAGMKQYAKAVAVSEELTARYPNDPEVLFHTSRLYADRAYQTMRQLIQGDPNSVWVHYATAEVQESVAHYDLAVAEYRTVIQMDPRLPGVHFRLGRAILLNSRDKKAIDDALHEFGAELAVSPENADAEYEIGEIHRQAGEFQEALQHFSRAVKDQPAFEEAQIGLARTLISLGQPRDAMTHLLAAIRLNPQNDVPHFLLASVYKSLGDAPDQQREMALFQKLRASGRSTGSTLPGLAAPQITQQELEPEATQHQ